MLRSSFGDSASSYPSAQTWAKKAVPFLLKINSADSGTPMNAPA
jgi:hypothetical protein